MVCMCSIETISAYIADVGYLDKDSYDVMQLAAWIPLVDATKENGCLQVGPPFILQGDRVVFVS